ncbi:MAG: protein kinase, partial [Phycisphaerae bacterium]
MKCEAVEALLLEFVEGSLTGPQQRRLAAHLDACAACRETHRETRTLINAFGDLKLRTPAARPSNDTSGSLTPQAPWGVGDVLGDFEILGLLGRGGMGVVYRARQRSLNRTVALKVLPARIEGGSALVERFRREANAAARMHHTNIVSVHTQGEQDGFLFYAMDLLEGRTLSEALRDDGLDFLDAVSRSPETADAAPKSAADARDARPAGTNHDYHRLASLFAEVADGLEHAHRQGVIHRDVKPNNLLINRIGHLHLTDFGLAQLLHEPSITMTGETIGTPAYMSPEQIDTRRGGVDHRTDIYSLGVTFYECLTGRRPFTGATRQELVLRICDSEPVSPRKTHPSIPIDLETICLRAMRKTPNRRYDTAGEMAADLRRFAERLPILARRMGPFEKTVRWVRRRPALSGAICLAGLLIVAAAAVISARRSSADVLVQRAYDDLAYGD